MNRIVVTGLLLVAGVVLVGGLGVYNALFRMPGESHSGKLPGLTEEQRRLERRLREHVRVFGSKIGERNLHSAPDNLRRAARYIEDQLRSFGYEPRDQSFRVDGRSVRNVIATRGDEGDDLLVVGAHYDTVRGSPGANDNGSGLAALLEMARRFRDRSTDRTLVFAAFVNEEPPYFKTTDMGSYRYARSLKESGRTVEAMISLETIGYYSEEPNSQHYPMLLSLLYPSRGNFLGFVGNYRHGDAVRTAINKFRERVPFPSRGIAAPALVPGIAWSDHWSFWQHGFPALMITDTAPFRYPHYHRPSDTPDKLDYGRLARVTDGLVRVVGSWARES